MSVSLEFVTRKDLPLFLFDIVAIATNGKLLLSGAPHIPQFYSDSACCLVSSARPYFSPLVYMYVHFFSKGKKGLAARLNYRGIWVDN